MRRSLALFVALAAAPAGALAPPLPDCTGAMMRPAEQHVFDAVEMDWTGYDVQSALQGFAYYRGSIGGTRPDTYYVSITVLEHCATRARLLARIPSEGLSQGAWFDRDEAVSNGIWSRASSQTKEAYTMQQIAAFAREAGAQTELTQGCYESCDCRVIEARGRG